jgi:hypothetical protein
VFDYTISEFSFFFFSCNTILKYSSEGVCNDENKITYIAFPCLLSILAAHEECFNSAKIVYF